MAKKTIGLNPLEEYLSSPRTAKRVPEVKVIEPEEHHSEHKESQKKFVQEPVQQPAPAPVQQLQSFDSAIEVDPQGQFAIKGTQVPEEKGDRPSKLRITLHLSSDIVDRIKNAVYWEPGLTVAGFAEDAFMKAINQLEDERGARFPQRKHHRLRGGRPVS
jgi:hypothetical protein